jgi:hypothetical protein
MRQEKSGPKSILFIAPEFFNFHQVIQDKLRALGYQVYFVPDRPSKHALIKILIRKARFLLGGYLWRHFTSVLEGVPADIDEVFIIKGEGLTPQLIEWMRTRFSSARFQLYLWDSLQNSSYALDWMCKMDRVWTFDYEDSKKYPELKLTANFYIKNENDSWESWRAEPVLYNLAFFGTAHADRLKVLSEITERMPKEMSIYRLIFFQTPLLYYFRKFFDSAFGKFRSDEMSFKPKLGSEWADIAKSTVAILDIHHPRQTGLTIRAIETLAMGMKLVTTNENIRHYPFYDERLVRIIDRENPSIEPEFLQSRSNVEPPEAVRNLELSRWLQRVMG